MNKHVDVGSNDKAFGTSCVAAVFGSGTAQAEDEVPSRDDSQEQFAEYDGTSNECDVQHCQKI